MSQDKKGKGFSGLSSLASKVDKPAAAKPPEDDGTRESGNSHEKAHRGDDSEPSRPQTRQSVPTSGTGGGSPSVDPLRVHNSTTPWLKIAWVIVGMVVLIALFPDDQERGSSREDRSSYDPINGAAEESRDTSTRTRSSDLEFSRPPIGNNVLLSVEQIRWCLRENIRIDVLRPLATTRSQIDKFNDLVNDYNLRCRSYRYREGSMTRAQREVQSVNDEITTRTRLTSRIWLSKDESTSEGLGSVQEENQPGDRWSQLTLDVQNLLNLLGYQPGPADGLYGIRTMRAIEAYEEDSGLRVTGAVTTDLRDKLRASLDNRQ